MRPTHGMKLVSLSVATQDGEFLAEYSAAGLARLHFPGERAARHRTATGDASPAVRSWHHATQAALDAILTGRTPRRFPPLDLSAGSAFQQTVWRALETIAGTVGSLGGGVS